VRVAPAGTGVRLSTRTAAWQEDWLDPVTIAGEVLRFDLSAYRSTVTREMAQVRLRMTRRAFAVGHSPLAANVVDGGAVLEVDAGALAAANAEVRRRLAAGPEWAVAYLRSLQEGGTLDALARAFARRPATGDVVAYLLAAAHYQALGALKFCLPDTLRPRLLALIEEPALVDALLSPDGPTLWSGIKVRELALARLRVRGPSERYRRRLEQHRRDYGYLGAEDVDFREHDTLDSIDARIAAIVAGARAERRRLNQALAADRARKAEARRRLAERLDGADAATLVSQILLARALAEHEDLNRRAKMRLLRDLRDRAQLAGLDIERDGLAALAATAESRQPVLRST
jgi:hypothetical protein